jgi:hypothetical protein
VLETLRSGFLARRIAAQRESRPRFSQPDSAVVILATRELASWLEDDQFTETLLRFISRDQKKCRQPRLMKVLTAAVDRVPFRGNSLRYGLSILSGDSKVMLPNMWSKASSPLKLVHPSLAFSVPPLTPGSPPLEVSVPAANTVFVTGRPSTVFGTRWESRWVPGRSPLDRRTMEFRLLKKITVEWQQVVRTHLAQVEHASSLIAVPLLPITRARKVIAGMGNIVRRLEVDGISAPASKELETEIPNLLRAREEKGLPPIEGPLNVWALVIPDYVANTRPDLLNYLDSAVTGYDEVFPSSYLPATAMKVFLEAGCRLLRICTFVM